MRELNRALATTHEDKAKWTRFSARVLHGSDATPENRALLEKAFSELVAWQVVEDKINDTPLAYGPGRIDAFGHIFNKVALLLNGPTAKGHPADAPVSIPFLWRVPQLDKVQYNGIAPKNSRSGRDTRPRCPRSEHGRNDRGIRRRCPKR